MAVKQEVEQYKPYYDDIKFDTWLPNLIVEDETKSAGQIVYAEDWNKLWNNHKKQGDYNSKTIYEMLRKLNQSVWNPEDGLAMLYHADPTVEEQIGDSVSAQLNWALKNTEQLLPVIENDNGVRFIKAAAFETVAFTTDIKLADYTLEAILTYLKDLHEELSSRVDDISVGTLEAFNHNDIGGRTVYGAHPTTAITHTVLEDTEIPLSAHLANVDELIDAIASVLGTLEERIKAHTDIGGSKHNAANIAVRYANTDNTVQAAISSLDLRISQITGDIDNIEALEILHANLPDCAISGHPADVITLSENNKYATVQEAMDVLQNFRMIYAGTTAPTSVAGNDGDIYIQYA